MNNPQADPRWAAAYVEETVRQRHDRDLERSELEREAAGDAVPKARRSPLAIVAWIVAGVIVVLAVLVWSGQIHL